jgi:acetylornithine deacetylase/succinyl-diaminopimelate desuccinylase-like protein
VVPPFADVICDCRTLPGQNVDDIRDYVGRALGADFRYELELLEPLAGGTESPTDTTLFEALREYAASRANAELLPLLSAGFTDSHWIREAWGTVAYGFAPVLFGDLDAYLNAAHANDEAIEIADLVEMAEFHYGLIRPDSD